MFNLYTLASVQEEGKDDEPIQSNTTPDPGNNMGEWQKHHTHDGQEVSSQVITY